MGYVADTDGLEVEGSRKAYSTVGRRGGVGMQIRVGYELIYECERPTPMILILNVHFTRVSDLVAPDHIITSPPVPVTPYRDGFGNWCSRIIAPSGEIRISTDAIIHDDGAPDATDPCAVQHAVEDLPAETLVFLLGSRYCETDRLSETAWNLFGQTSPGWSRVRAICDFVHEHILFGATSTPARPGPRSKCSANAWACVATTRISRSRSVAA